MPIEIASRVVLFSALLCSCARHGAGQGELEETAGAASGADLPVGAVDFRWRSGGSPSDGTISATLPDGLAFSGTYLQVTDTSWQPNYGPYWLAWTDADWGAPPWYNGVQVSFVTDYSGKALAHLKATDGTRMRCVFTLRDPQNGLGGGGEGDCQLSTSEKVVGARLYADVEQAQ